MPAPTRAKAAPPEITPARSFDEEEAAGGTYGGQCQEEEEQPDQDIQTQTQTRSELETGSELQGDPVIVDIGRWFVKVGRDGGEMNAVDRGSAMQANNAPMHPHPPPHVSFSAIVPCARPCSNSAE